MQGFGYLLGDAFWLTAVSLQLVEALNIGYNDRLQLWEASGCYGSKPRCGGLPVHAWYSAMVAAHCMPTAWHVEDLSCIAQAAAVKHCVRPASRRAPVVGLTCACRWRWLGIRPGKLQWWGALAYTLGILGFTLGDCSNLVNDCPNSYFNVLEFVR